MFLAIFEFLGTSELLIILVVALILFGPRRLPQLSRQLGKSLGEFKRASEDFKRTWEKEVELEKLEQEADMARAMLQDDHSILGDATDRRNALDAVASESASATEDDAVAIAPLQPTVARSAPGATSEQAEPALAGEAAPPAPDTSSKRDWL
ncbi:MAG TPA: twin-arginine translocase TatA/TatE family subunit [Pyrinomonadaceae bacterium]|nr:twin-arginine translocase TatA/TatE family subunit [Pyrinomonadaceae bacterium]